MAVSTIRGMAAVSAALCVPIPRISRAACTGAPVVLVDLDSVVTHVLATTRPRSGRDFMDTLVAQLADLPSVRGAQILVLAFTIPARVPVPVPTPAPPPAAPKEAGEMDAVDQWIQRTHAQLGFQLSDEFWPPPDRIAPSLLFQHVVFAWQLRRLVTHKLTDAVHSGHVAGLLPRNMALLNGIWLSDTAEYARMWTTAALHDTTAAAIVTAHVVLERCVYDFRYTGKGVVADSIKECPLPGDAVLRLLATLTPAPAAAAAAAAALATAVLITGHADAAVMALLAMEHQRRRVLLVQAIGPEEDMGIDLGAWLRDLQSASAARGLPWSNLRFLLTVTGHATVLHNQPPLVPLDTALRVASMLGGLTTVPALPPADLFPLPAAVQETPAPAPLVWRPIATLIAVSAMVTKRPLPLALADCHALPLPLAAVMRAAWLTDYYTLGATLAYGRGEPFRALVEQATAEVAATSQHRRTRFGWKRCALSYDPATSSLASMEGAGQSVVVERSEGALGPSVVVSLVVPVDDAHVVPPLPAAQSPLAALWW
jgi:hypothetical protein